ncbi:MAG: hypothetical protein ACLP01_17220 [Solirubrobacteraceae bacterium]
MQVAGGVHETAASELINGLGAGFGVAAVIQLVPPQDSAKVDSGRVDPPEIDPTATHDVAEVHEVLSREAPGGA